MANNTKKSKKATKAKRTHTNWALVKKMWDAGDSYQAIAKATDPHYDPKKPDPTKPTRAKVWKARHQGVMIDGKMVRFGRRGTATKAHSPTTKKKGVPKLSRKLHANKPKTHEATHLVQKETPAQE